MKQKPTPIKERAKLIAARDAAALSGDTKKALRLQRKADALKPKPTRKRPTKTDRLRGPQTKGNLNVIELMRTDEGRSKLRELANANKQRWTIIGAADAATRHLADYASFLGFEWSADFTLLDGTNATERDLHDAAARLHCVRESHKRGDLENAACHLYSLGQYVERLRVRVLEALPRLGTGQQRKVVFEILDEANGELKRRNERGVTFSSNAVWAYATKAPKMKQKTKDNWFTEWRKARGL
jgi:hypothetical protein